MNYDLSQVQSIFTFQSVWPNSTNCPSLTSITVNNGIGALWSKGAFPGMDRLLALLQQTILRVTKLMHVYLPCISLTQTVVYYMGPKKNDKVL